jgi:opacity protein-like surface antigen
MKTYAYVLTVLAAAMVSTSALAAGADSSPYQGALFNGDSTKFYDTVHSGGPRNVSVGVGIDQQNREMEMDNAVFVDQLEANHIMATLGYDVTKWFTLYGGLGSADVNLGNDNRSSNMEWLLGGQFRILDYMVLEPWNDIDQYWVGVDANSYVRNTKVEGDAGYYDNFSENLTEIFASLTISFYSQPEKPGAWNRVGIYVGPAISFIEYGDQSESQPIGFIGGLQLSPSPNISMKVEFQQFDDTGMGASIGFHF